MFEECTRVLECDMMRAHSDLHLWRHSCLTLVQQQLEISGIFWVVAERKGVFKTRQLKH